MTIKKINKRKKIHNRSVHCEGFLREDGLWDIEDILEIQKRIVLEVTIEVMLKQVLLFICLLYTSDAADE